jgi:hypothetical protein
MLACQLAEQRADLSRSADNPFTKRTTDSVCAPTTDQSPAALGTSGRVCLNAELTSRAR